MISSSSPPAHSTVSGSAARIGGWLPGATTPLQGHLALVTRATDRTWIERFRPLDFRMHLFEQPSPAPVAPTAAGEEQGRAALLHTGTRPERYTGRGPVLHWPMIELDPAPRAERIAALAGDLGSCVSVLLASPFAARCLVDALFHGPGPEAMDGRRMLAVGPATAEELERLGWRADAVAPGYGGLSALLAGGACTTGRCFYPCSTAAPLAERAAALRAAGLEPVPRVFYRTRPRSPGPLPETPFDRVLFASASGVDAYFTAYPDERVAARTWLAVGASTLAALQKWGVCGECIHED
jgi:uroporphyrinogen-III synthase